MNNPNLNGLTADTAAAARSATLKKRGRLVESAKRAGTRESGKPGPKGKTTSKKELLVELLSKPGGARVSKLVERLSWKSHTVRAALSRLRKQGHQIKTSKSAKGDEAVYSIVGAPPAGKAKFGKASA